MFGYHATGDGCKTSISCHILTNLYSVRSGSAWISSSTCQQWLSSWHLLLYPRLSSSRSGIDCNDMTVSVCCELSRFMHLLVLSDLGDIGPLNTPPRLSCDRGGGSVHTKFPRTRSADNFPASACGATASRRSKYPAVERLLQGTVQHATISVHWPE